MFGKNFIWLLIVILLGAAVRLYHLGTESIWLNEAGTVVLAQKSIEQLLDHVAFFDVHPPLYYIFMHYWIELFGISEFWVRFPSLIFGVISIFTIFLIGKKLFSNRAALLSAFLLATSLFHIHYSQEARGYSLLALFVSLSMLFYLRILEQKHTRSDCCLYILFTALSLYTHNFALFSWFSQNIFYFISRFFPNFFEIDTQESNVSAQ